MFLPNQNQNEQNQKVTRKPWEVLDLSVALIVVMASRLFAYVQTHQIVHTKYVRFFVNQLYLNKAVKTGFVFYFKWHLRLLSNSKYM